MLFLMFNACVVLGHCSVTATITVTVTKFFFVFILFFIFIKNISVLVIMTKPFSKLVIVTDITKYPYKIKLAVHFI